MDLHITATGEQIPVRDLSDTHLRNIIAMIERKAKEGIVVATGGGGLGDWEDVWYHEEELEGRQVLDHFDYDKYIKERDRRKKLNIKPMDTYTVTIDLRGKVRVQVKARSLSEAAELAYEDNEGKIIAAIEHALAPIGTAEFRSTSYDADINQ